MRAILMDYVLIKRLPLPRYTPLMLTCEPVTLLSCRYKDGDLSVGENTCIDRCSSKYWQVI